MTALTVLIVYVAIIGFFIWLPFNLHKRRTMQQPLQAKLMEFVRHKTLNVDRDAELELDDGKLKGIKFSDGDNNVKIRFYSATSNTASIGRGWSSTHCDLEKPIFSKERKAQKRLYRTYATMVDVAPVIAIIDSLMK